jgi:hypothetical protein
MSLPFESSKVLVGHGSQKSDASGKVFITSMTLANIHTCQRCLAHVIHLATRALISTYSKAPYYTPEHPNLTTLQENGHRDEVGLIRAIAVKASLLSRVVL